jgi:hypothetical protein
VEPSATSISATSNETPVIPVPQPIPLRDVAPWLILGGLLLLLAVYFVGVEQGALSLISNRYVHEFVHDGRHLLGFPCH